MHDYITRCKISFGYYSLFALEINSFKIISCNEFWEYSLVCTFVENIVILNM